MKKVLSALVLIILSFAFVLVGCASGLELPPSNASVKGNGGFVVQKGEYIYFANAYTGYATLASDVSNSDKQYNIYRVKVSDYTNAIVAFDEDGFAKGVELIASKVAGFENSGFYIVGDFLYFASPNTHKTNRNENRFDLVTIFSVKLDGSSQKELYTTSDYTNGDWSVLQIGNKAYLLTVENDKIIRQEVKNGKISGKTTLADDVLSAKLVREVTSDFDKKIYYTTNLDKERTELGFSGNVLKNVDIESGKVTKYSNSTGETITILKQQNSKLFYTVLATGSVTKLYVKSASGADRKISDWTDATKLFFLGYNNDSSAKPVVFVSQSKLVMQTFDSMELTVLVNENVTPLFTSGDYVYYSTSTGISRISYKTKVAEVIATATFQSGVFDFDGRYIYVFKTVEESESTTKYIHRIDTFTFEQNGSQEIKPIAFVLEDDKPKDEE